MYPALSPLAREALRHLPIDTVGLEPDVARELVAKAIWPPDGHYLTDQGARYVLDVFVAEREAAICAACGARYGAHNGAPPHDNPETGCRAFTHGEPPRVARRP